MTDKAIYDISTTNSVITSDYDIKDIGSGNPTDKRFKIKDGIEWVVATYYFYLVVMESGSIIHTSPQLTLNVVCGNDASLIEASSITSPQSAESSSGNEFFVMPPYSSMVAACP